MTDTKLNELIAITVRVPAASIVALRREAEMAKGTWGRNYSFRSTESGKAEASGMYQFWAAIMAQMDDVLKARTP